MDRSVLVAKAQSGNIRALGELLMAYRLDCYAVALRLGGGPEEAEDTCQEAFLRATGTVRSYFTCPASRRFCVPPREDGQKGTGGVFLGIACIRRISWRQSTGEGGLMGLSQKHDGQLLAEYVRGGSPDAVEELFRRHGALAYSVCLRRMGSAADAEDVASAVFLILLQKARSLTGRSSLAGWIHQCAVNATRNALRLRRSRARHEKEAGEMRRNMSEEERSLWNSALPHLDEALASLPARQRDVLVLQYMEGHSRVSVAERLGCPESTVARRARLGLEKLRRRLAPGGVAISTGLLAAGLAEPVGSTSPSQDLARNVVRLVAGEVSRPEVSAVVRGTVRTMRLAMLKAATLVAAVLTATVVAGGFTASRLLAAEPKLAPVLAKAPVNKWVKLPGTLANGYRFSSPVYAPYRGRLLHWGASNKRPAGNDVRAFDPVKAVWNPDYASDPRGMYRASAITHTGLGRMLSSGRPMPAMVGNAVTYDTRRKLVVYSMPNLMAAYDPATRKWRNLKARARLYGKEYPGGPPVYNSAMCYDPVNDEIVMFPAFGGQNIDMREVTGRISGHLGTWRYSYKESLWKRVGSELGTAQIRKAREAVIGLLGNLSPALDAVWAARGRKDGKALAAAGKELAACAAAAGKASLPAEAKGAMAGVIAALKEAAAKASGDAGGALKSGTRAVWKLEALLAEKLGVEPPPRAVAPMVYDPKNKVIVMFGGDSNQIRADLNDTIKDGKQLRSARYACDRKLNDTWVYDVKTRQWREISKAQRPPAVQAPNLHYDPHSGQMLLLTFGPHTSLPKTTTLWSLDVKARKWHKRLEEPWPGKKGYNRWPWFTTGLDPKHRLLLLATNHRNKQETWAMRYDVGRMPSAPAPAWKPPPPIEPTVIPPDDPAWVAKLKSLPANRWVPARPPREPARRDWGNIACDPVRGWIVFFGGGHSTYQGTDVAIYQVGANRWVHQAGGHNDSVPGAGWGGSHLSFNGAFRAGHMRNHYVCLDGRMFLNLGLIGAEAKVWWKRNQFTDAMKVYWPQGHYTWFYDIDRGGVWRQQRVKFEGKVPKMILDRIDRLDNRPSVVDTDGRAFALNGTVLPKAHLTVLDIYENRLSEQTVTSRPSTRHTGESRPFCMIPEKDLIFYLNTPKTKDPAVTGHFKTSHQGHFKTGHCLRSFLLPWFLLASFVSESVALAVD